MSNQVVVQPDSLLVGFRKLIHNESRMEHAGLGLGEVTAGPS